jgi:LysR family transcriptional regulator, glycine cleavage system transcriptional activator
MSLRCFEASARLASFTRAAQEVHLSQGAVSHQVIGLEEMLGIQLFTRRRAGLELTAVGRGYLDQVAMALRQIERATQEVLTNKGRGGTLNLSVASSFASYWLMPRLASFVAAHPEVTLNLSTKIGPVDFRASLLDASIEFCAGAFGDIAAVKVLDLTLQPYAAPSVARRYMMSRARQLRSDELLNLLRHEPLIRHTTVQEAWSSWMEVAFPNAEVDLRQVHGGPVYDLLSMALNGAIGGIGVALLPQYLAQGAVRSGQLIQLSRVGWTAADAYYLRQPSWKGDFAPLQTFREWLLQLGG